MSDGRTAQSSGEILAWRTWGLRRCRRFIPTITTTGIKDAADPSDCWPGAPVSAPARTTPETDPEPSATKGGLHSLCLAPRALQRWRADLA